jgi:DNA-binding GntR family transcriptional regulator
MRRILEPYAARKAVAGLTPQALAKLEEARDAMHRSGAAAQTGEDHFQDYKEFAAQDAAFHRIIAEHSGNSLLSDATARLRSHMHQYRIYFNHGVVDETSEEHDAVLEALRSGDGAAAEKAMLDHLEKSYKRISASLETAEKSR